MTEQEYKDKLRAEEIAKGPNNRFSLFHPVGGRLVFNPDEPTAVEDLKKLEAQGWCESPLEFWDAETVETKVIGGFFNRQYPVPDSYRKDVKASRGSAKPAVSGHSGDFDDRGGEEFGSEALESSGDSVPSKRGHRGSSAGRKKTATVVG